MEKCPTCGTLLEKNHSNFNSKDKVSLVTLWRCPKCKKYVDRKQYDIKK